MKVKMAIPVIAFIFVMVGVVFALPPTVQHFPPIKRPIAVHPLCDTLSVSPDTPVPEVGQEGVFRLQCPGSASSAPSLNCSNWSQGLDCAFYVGNSRGGGGGYATPTFTLPTGYVHIWVKGAATGSTGDPTMEVQDCSNFDDDGHWLTSGTPVFLGNISHVYCAHVDADTADLATFDVTWS